MPYIAVKAYPKDDKIKNLIAEKINEAFMEAWGCPQEAISISFEEISPDDWNDKVVKPIIEPNADKMKILNGVKKYK